MFSHLDAQNRPAMVDVGDKAITRRTAVAAAVVALPPELVALVREGEIVGKKGPIFRTAVLAGVMGAKRTSDLIPLCHPLALNNCQVTVTPNADSREITIRCMVSTDGKTGVEMEALTGASVAALTLYDMAKAVSHEIVIKEIRLLEKTGGKSDYRADTAKTETVEQAGVAEMGAVGLGAVAAGTEGSASPDSAGSKKSRGKPAPGPKAAQPKARAGKGRR